MAAFRLWKIESLQQFWTTSNFEEGKRASDVECVNRKITRRKTVKEALFYLKAWGYLFCRLAKPRLRHRYEPTGG
jgi:hypothetical protein